MPIEAGVYRKLRDDPNVSALVSGRIFGVRLPNDCTYPAVVWQVIVTTDLGYNFQGASGLRLKRFQFDSYAKNYIDSVNLSDTIRALFQSYSGTLPDGTAVNGCIVVEDMDLPYEVGTSTAGGYVNRRMIGVEFIYSE